MEYIKELESGSSPKIAKAVQHILKNKSKGYCPYLLNALIKSMKQPRLWKTQCKVIKAIGVTGCENALPLLKELIDDDYEYTILYKELGFAIFMIENRVKINLSFFFESVEKGNVLQISGVCAAILYKKIIPKKNDIKKIINGIEPYVEGEGQKITPRCYIAAIAHLWPKDETQNFLEACKKSKFSGLVEIAEYALQGKESKIQLI